jgi:hypothetical protein
MATSLDNLPKHLQSLQLLIEQFRDADDWDERDEVLADIAKHDTPEALAFLRLVAENPEEDVYARCEATCAIALRTNGAEGGAALLAYLDDVESVYEFCRAADTLAELKVEGTVEKLWAAWDKALDEEARHSALLALEALDPTNAAHKLSAELTAQDSVAKLRFERNDLILKMLARVKIPETRTAIEAWSVALLVLAKTQPEDQAELEDMADLVREAIVRFDEPSEPAAAPAPDDAEDDL